MALPSVPDGADVRLPTRHRDSPSTGRGTVLTVYGPEPRKLVDAHPKRPPAAAAVDVEEVVAT